MVLLPLIISKVLSSLSRYYIDGCMQNCSISGASANELLQPCTKPSTYAYDERFKYCNFTAGYNIHAMAEGLEPNVMSQVYVVIKLIPCLRNC